MNCSDEVCHKQLNYSVNFGLTFPILRDILGLDNESIKKKPPVKEAFVAFSG
jgi:hypothetical protein